VDGKGWVISATRSQYYCFVCRVYKPPVPKQTSELTDSLSQKVSEEKQKDKPRVEEKKKKKKKENAHTAIITQVVQLGFQRQEVEKASKEMAGVGIVVTAEALINYMFEKIDSSNPATKVATTTKASTTTTTPTTVATNSSAGADLVKAQGEMDLCVLCFDKPINSVVIPCGHLAMCFDCGNEVKTSMKTCPVCRQAIIAIIKTFHV